MSAVWLDPYSPMKSSAAADSGLVDDAVSLIRQDTPYDHERWQYSPALSASPELDCKRVRRKPSIQNLTGRSAQAAFARLQISVPPPSSIHSSGPHDSRPHQLQHPSTPRPRAYTASPSLSSTITTLQSTPTDTPILRGGSFDAQRREYEWRALEQPISTKRKYPSVKHARRFPRQHTGEEESGDSGIYKVYAAVFDISSAEKGLSKDSSVQAAPIGKEERAVRFGKLDTRHEHDISSTFCSGRSLHRRDQTVNSSFSLSNFEFPAPPNRDNWTGAINHLPKSPSATVLYRGASFDLINPHASLLLGKNSIETPAEIDCLLDEYFEDHDDFVVMSSDPITGEISQQSIRSASDSKQTHVLYDDADTARRNILRIPTPNATEGVAVPIMPPATAVTMPSFVLEPASNLDPGALPLMRTNTNPFRNKMTAIGRSLGLTTGAENRNLAEEGRSLDHAGTCGFSTTTGMQATKRYVGADNEEHFTAHDGERFSNLSNPFDLTVSEVRNNAERMNIDGVAMRTRSAMMESASDPTGQRTVPTVEDDSNTHAVSESGGDYELSFINRYDYICETIPRGTTGHSLSGASIEFGRGAKNYSEENSHGWATPVSPGAQFRSFSYGFRTVEDPEEMRPRPLASRRRGIVQRSNMPSIHREMRLSGTSDVPTSEKTYGETNQLLQITPNVNANVANRANLADLRYDPLTRAHHPWGIGTPWFQDENEDLYNAPGFHYDGSVHPLTDGRPESSARIRTGSMALSPSIVQISHELDIHRYSVPSVLRTSTEHAEGDESNWVDEETGDSPGYTEDEDPDDNGDRYSHSPYSGSRPQLEPADDPQRTTSADHRQHLALDSFPNLNNPSSEISPQRERRQGQDRDVASKRSLCPPPTLFPHSSIERGDSSDRIRVPCRQIDFYSRPNGDVKRALTILKRKALVDKLGAGKFMSPGAHTTREFGDMQELERIRVYNPDAIDEATARFQFVGRGGSSSLVVAQTSSPNIVQTSLAGNKLKKVRNALGRQNHNPIGPFQKTAGIGHHETAHGSFSSRRGLLSPQEPDTNLEFSASEGTFVTIRNKRHRNGSKLDHSRDWDPHGIDPTANALELLRSRTINARRVPSNLQSSSNRSGPQETPAVDGQIELRQFTLRAPGAHRGLTDKELYKRAPSWHGFPPENSLQRNDARLLSHNRPSKEEMDISLKYLTLSALLPFCALVYGLGGFDWIIARKTQGRIKSMAHDQKRYALMVYFPSQLLAYSIIGVVVGIGIYMRYHKSEDKY